ncbi:A/B/D/E cyclin [Mycena olivaceomarginata]|nr:A/B/D/E cyclin [Mycena olivaceomarginata]
MRSLIPPTRSVRRADPKHKREALHELNCGVTKEECGWPKKWTTATHRALRTVADEKCATTATRVPDVAHRRRWSNGRSLIPVLQRQKQVPDEPISKRQCRSSVDPEDVAAELEVSAALDAYSGEAEPEATPDDDLWEDVDAVDFDDPTMASEYITDIQRYLRGVERNTMPNPNYMDSQPNLTWEMRAVLNAWLIQVHTRFRLLPETLFLCTNLVDRFLSTRSILRSKLQLVGMACLLIASKFEETISPAVANFILLCSGAYTAADMLQAEQRILCALDWDLSYPSPVHYLRRISKADGYLAEIACVEHRLLPAQPSLLAAAAIWLARIALGADAWTPSLVHYAMYAENVLIPVATHMLYYVVQPIRHESLYKKYAGKRNMKASVYMRQWALARWAEGTMLDLAADLPAMKNEIRVQKHLRSLRKAQRAAAPEPDEDPTCGDFINRSRAELCGEAGCNSLDLDHFAR